MRALWRRFWWRARWRITRAPWLLPLGKHQVIAVPYGGCGALIYYQGFSEPETVDFVLRFLRPGMTFLDVGAHIGEYVLIGAECVGPKGMVHAFEPNPDVLGILEANLIRNRHTNVRVNRVAVSDIRSMATFDICREPAVSSLKPTRIQEALDSRIRKTSIEVETIRLDDYLGVKGGRVDLIKVDVEGAEFLVLKGAAKLLSRPPERAPVLLFEHSLQNYGRFGYGIDEMADWLYTLGYGLFRYHRGPAITEYKVAPRSDQLVNIVATKDKNMLEASFRECRPDV